MTTVLVHSLNIIRGHAPKVMGLGKQIFGEGDGVPPCAEREVKKISNQGGKGKAIFFAVKRGASQNVFQTKG